MGLMFYPFSLFLLASQISLTDLRNRCGHSSRRTSDLEEMHYFRVVSSKRFSIHQSQFSCRNSWQHTKNKEVLILNNGVRSKSELLRGRTCFLLLIMLIKTRGEDNATNLILKTICFLNKVPGKQWNRLPCSVLQGSCCWESSANCFNKAVQLKMIATLYKTPNVCPHQQSQKVYGPPSAAECIVMDTLKKATLNTPNWLGGSGVYHFAIVYGRNTTRESFIALIRKQKTNYLQTPFHEKLLDISKGLTWPITLPDSIDNYSLYPNPEVKLSLNVFQNKDGRRFTGRGCSKISKFHHSDGKRKTVRKTKVLNSYYRRNYIRIFENCPNKCMCQMVVRIFIIIQMDCENRSLDRAPSRIPFGTKTVNLGRNEIRSMASIDIYWWKHVTHLSLSNNKFKSLDGIQSLAKISFIGVRGNHLSELPPYLMEGVTKGKISGIYLSDNSWNCSCEYRDFIKWLKSNYYKIKDYSRMYCYWPEDGSKIKISEAHLALRCTKYVISRIETVKIIVTLFVLFVPTALLIAALYARRTLILSPLYARNLYPAWPERDVAGDSLKLYDLFVCYHITDREIAKILISILGHSLRVCVQEHGWISKTRSEQDFLFRFFASKMTIILMSRRFVKTMWFHTEFRRTYNTEIKFHLKRLITIIIRSPGMDYYLNVMVETIYPTENILTWTERWLWEKLYFMLRKVRRNT